VDCLRADHLSCYGYKRKTTPFIDFLASRGIKFENAFANGPFTAASFLSILASAYPLEFKDQLPLPPDAILISEVLQETGIRTAAINSNPYLSAFYGYNRGWHCFRDFLINNRKTFKKRRSFKRIRNVLPKTISEILHLARVYWSFTKSYESAETVTECAISWLSRNKDFPFFLWLHYMDLHEPYLIFNANFKRKYSKDIPRLLQVKFLNDMKRERIEPKTINGLVNIYDDKLSYVDENLKELHRFLIQERLVDNTLIVITSDHGQEFWDHGHFGHTARFYDEILHIPLILFGSKIKNVVDRRIVSQLDIAPTILNFYGVPVPRDYRGHNLLSRFSNPFVISEAAHNEEGIYISEHRIFPSNLRTYAIRTKKWKYIHGSRQHELYNLQKDPKETINIIDEERVKAEELKSIIRKHLLWEEKLQKQRERVLEKKRIHMKIKKLKFLDKI